MNKKNYNLLLSVLVFLLVTEILFIPFQFSDLRIMFNQETNRFSRVNQLDNENFYLNLNQVIQANLKRPSSTKSAPMPKPISNPPEILRAIYLTSWSAGQKATIDYLINLSKETDINAVVIDIKDYSGHIFYKTSSPLIQEYKSEKDRIKDINALIQRLHNNNIYVIARIVVFQDPVLAFSNPKLAIHDKSKASSHNFPSSTTSLAQNEKFFNSTSTLWFNNTGSPWIDPSSREAWKYNLSLARDADQRGFDEINFDYVRFPSRGNLENTVFPFWKGKLSKHLVIKEFYKYLHQNLVNTKISLDIFGMTTVSSNGLGIGQVLEDSFGYFDYVCPMVYPSHYSRGFLGHYNPADYPYEVIRYSMDNALNKLLYFENSVVSMTSSTSTATSSFIYSSSSSSSSSSSYSTLLSRSYQKISHCRRTKLRPWLQYFDLGAVYDEKMIQLEIKAVKDALKNQFKGFMFWNPNNIYRKDVLE